MVQESEGRGGRRGGREELAFVFRGPGVDLRDAGRMVMVGCGAGMGGEGGNVGHVESDLGVYFVWKGAADSMMGIISRTQLILKSFWGLVVVQFSRSGRRLTDQLFKEDEHVVIIDQSCRSSDPWGPC